MRLNSKPTSDQQKTKYRGSEQAAEVGHTRIAANACTSIQGAVKKSLAVLLCLVYFTAHVAGPALAQVNFTYDSKNRVKTKTYPNGQGYSFGYDKLGRLVSQGFPAATGTGSSGTEYYGYFGPDVFNSFTDLRGLTTNYAVTGVGGFKKSVTAPDTGAFTYQRNSYGRVESYTDARGVTASIGYGPGNRIASVTYPDNTVTLTYGTPGQPRAGKVVGMTDSSGSTTWGYNRSGQLLSMTQTVGSVTKTVGYTYLGPKLASVTYPSGNVVSYEYDRGNLVTIKINSVVALSNMKHYPFGSLMSWTTAGAGNYSQTRDLRGRVTAYSFDTGSRAVGWDASNRVTSLTNPGSVAWTYGYDNLDRITSATEGGSNRTYSYDLNHNKTGEVLNGAAYDYVIATNSSRIQTATVVNSQNVPETRSYIYDNAGNVLTDGLRTLTWNGAGKVATLTKDGLTTTYTYNGQGTRVKKSNSLGTTHFVYQGTDVLGEYAGVNGTGSYTETVYAEGIPVALIRDGAVYYVFPDYLGTPRTVKNTAGATVWKWASDPYGVQAPNENPGGVSLFHWNARFPGQYADDESLLYFNNARYYDAPTGRYYSSDPIGLDGGSNTYAYVRGNPLRAIDPSGNFGIPGAIAGGIVGGISGGLGASATGGNVVVGIVIGTTFGAIIGGLGGFIAPKVVGTTYGSLAWNMSLRALAGGIGNITGQAQTIGNPCFAFNKMAIAGSVAGGALGGFLSAGAWGTNFGGPLAPQVLQRVTAGLPGASISGVSSIVGKKLGQPLVCNCESKK